MRIKVFINDITNDYTNIDDIEPCFYDNVIYINCHDHKLKNIDFINKFPNLRILIASNNYLTYTPDHSKLEILDVNTNKITKLGVYPKLLKLYAFNNLLYEYSVPITVFELDLSNNKLRKLNYNKKQIFLLFSIKYNNLDILLSKKNKYNNLYEKSTDYLYTIYESE
jgi:hypothetical protein